MEFIFFSCFKNNMASSLKKKKKVERNRRKRSFKVFSFPVFRHQTCLVIVCFWKFEILQCNGYRKKYGTRYIGFSLLFYLFFFVRANFFFCDPLKSDLEIKNTSEKQLNDLKNAWNFRFIETEYFYSTFSETKPFL